MIIRTTAMAALIVAAVPGLGFAQTAPTRIVPQNRPDQTPAAPHPPQASPEPPKVEQAPPRVRPFVLAGVQLQGSTLPPAAVAAAYRPFVGRTMDGRNLIQLSDAIAAVYETAGYALYTVIIPDQDFAGGVARLVAVEGYIEGARIEGPTDRRRRALVDSYVAKLKAEKPLKRRTLQRYVSLIRDIPGLFPEANLSTGSQPGAVNLDLVLKPRTAQFGLGVNNRGTAYLGRTQVQADLYLNSLLRQGDRTQLTVAAPTRAQLFQYYGLGHIQPIGADGATVQANVGYMRTKPKNTGLRGRATSAGVQVSYPIIRSFNQDLYLNVGLDGLNADNAFLGFTFSDDRTRAVRATLSYSKTTEKSLLAASGSLSRGVNALGARVTSSALSELDFTKVNGRLAFNRVLGDVFVVRLAGAGQYSGDRLPGSEQFALGGDEFGRGFEASIVAGDYGYGASAELAWRPAKVFTGALSGSELYGFADGGEVWYRGRLGFPASNASVRSAGGGARFVVKQRAVIQVEAARGLNDPVPFLDRENWRGIVNIRTLF